VRPDPGSFLAEYSENMPRHLYRTRNMLNNRSLSRINPSFDTLE
jgi:hypothetical protein